MRKILKNISLWVLVLTLTGFSGNWVLGMKRQQTETDPNQIQTETPTVIQTDPFIPLLKSQINIEKIQILNAGQASINSVLAIPLDVAGITEGDSIKDPIKGVFLKQDLELSEFIKQAKQVGVTIKEIISNEATSTGFKKLEDGFLYHNTGEGQVYVFSSTQKPNIDDMRALDLLTEEQMAKLKAPQATTNTKITVSSFVEVSDGDQKMVIDTTTSNQNLIDFYGKESEIAKKLKAIPEVIQLESQPLKPLEKDRAYIAGDDQFVVSGSIENLQSRITAQQYDMKANKVLSFTAEEEEERLVQIMVPKDQKIAIIRQDIGAEELKKALSAAEIKIPAGDGAPSGVVSEISKSSKMVKTETYKIELDGIFISSNDGLTELKAISDLGFEGTKLGKEIEKKDTDLAQAQLEKQQAEQSNQIAQNEKNAADANKDAAELEKNTAEQKLQVAESENTKLITDLQDEKKERSNNNAKIVELEEQIKALKLKSVKPEFTVEDLVTKMKDPKFKSALESKLKTDKAFKSNMTKSAGSSYFVPAGVGTIFGVTGKYVVDKYTIRSEMKKDFSVIDEIGSQGNYQQADNSQQNIQQDNGTQGYLSEPEQSNQEVYEISAQ